MTPQLFDESQVGKLYLPRHAEFAKEGLAMGLPPAVNDNPRILLVIVDKQIDFVFPDGALSVPGAVDDTVRLIKWIYQHVGKLTAVMASLDSHVPTQIFYPTWWVSPDGKHPDPFTVISVKDLTDDVWRPANYPTWSNTYVRKLEEQGNYQLMIWPYHTMIGEPGQALVPALSEAIAFHSAARMSQPTYITKGTVPQVEHYGIWRPEVEYKKHHLGVLNTHMLEALNQYDTIYFAGQAKSHCVLSTMKQTLEFFEGQPEVITKFRFLMDCTSSVFHPDIDFDAIANEEYAKMEKRGLVLIKSTDPVG